MRKLREELSSQKFKGQSGITRKIVKGVPTIVKDNGEHMQNFLISTSITKTSEV